MYCCCCWFCPIKSFSSIPVICPLLVKRCCCYKNMCIGEAPDMLDPWFIGAIVIPPGVNPEDTFPRLFIWAAATRLFWLSPFMSRVLGCIIFEKPPYWGTSTGPVVALWWPGIWEWLIPDIDVILDCIMEWEFIMLLLFTHWPPRLACWWDYMSIDEWWPVPEPLFIPIEFIPTVCAPSIPCADPTPWDEVWPPLAVLLALVLLYPIFFFIRFTCPVLSTYWTARASILYCSM